MFIYRWVAGKSSIGSQIVYIEFLGNYLKHLVDGLCAWFLKHWSETSLKRDGALIKLLYALSKTGSMPFPFFLSMTWAKENNLHLGVNDHIKIPHNRPLKLLSSDIPYFLRGIIIIEVALRLRHCTTTKDWRVWKMEHATELGGGWWHDQKDYMKIKVIVVEGAGHVAFVDDDVHNVEGEEAFRHTHGGTHIGGSCSFVALDRIVSSSLFSYSGPPDIVLRMFYLFLMFGKSHIVGLVLLGTLIKFLIWRRRRTFFPIRGWYTWLFLIKLV